MKFAAIDFETANEKRNSACSIGVVRFDEQEILDEYYSLINPMSDFRSMNIRIHGIREDDVQDAPTFEDLWPALYEKLEGHIIVAHNASFDMSVLRQSLLKYDLRHPDFTSLCTVKISQRVWPHLENHRLHTVADYHDIPLIHHHALEDAKASAFILMKALEAQQDGNAEHFLERWLASKASKRRSYPKTGSKNKTGRGSTKLYL
ncbi:exonuclease [Oceanobacillus oncorhynchi subsp. incaldanensis]|uniref:DNA polymerase III PolC-type n=2 Tax=Oceanobacillus TaxID=182709 RepID=A0A0A1MVH5_9BACI|nr:3'-5' exonuclease [Oceanobacillus oncorhynchi]MDM8099606.1 3'-5' exonuclease [Oceanobacillus oncorhynchi]UUI41941.1 3'-5' exonuclease [Oceanobacillus oncorhynchi]GIO19994.1 exonuclease [Oceanobacillus oncorhynchi subsp. incaldanensis]CEI83447.1 DNA polymerase III PolC-type [Oceanobacillus oncorhynchi]